MITGIKGIDNIVESYEKYLAITMNDATAGRSQVRPREPNLYYTEAAHRVSLLYVEEGDIQLFLDRIIAYKDEDNFGNTGIFVSALINSMDEKGLITLNLPVRMHYLGMYLHDIGMLELRGDVGSYLGHCMSDSLIVARDSVGDYAGSMMKDSFVKVYGNAGEKLGHRMDGKMIKVAGSIGSVSSMVRSGRIYQADELILNI